eukprot:1118160-Amorphochlora_amoeboformis.AAC.2
MVTGRGPGSRREVLRENGIPVDPGAMHCPLLRKLWAARVEAGILGPRNLILRGKKEDKWAGFVHRSA